MSEQNDTATIYGLVDPRTNRVRYVGKTTWSLQHRLRGHLSDIKVRPRSHKANWLKGLLAQGLRPRIVVLQRVSTESWQEAECNWIGVLSAVCGDLTNVTPGGDAGGWGWRPGSLAPSSKLTEESVRTICERYAAGGITQARLAAEHGVNVGTVAHIVRGVGWKHVERPTVIREPGAPGIPRNRKNGFALGVRNGNAKLTPAKVRAIRLAYSAGARQVDLASRYGVNQTQISVVVRRKVWAHV